MLQRWLQLIRCILSFAAIHGWTLIHLDINNAFIYGELDEKIYMKAPHGYLSKIDPRVCKLQRSLYGLKQASRQYNSKFTSVLIQFGFS